jgi:hypothetical protein
MTLSPGGTESGGTAPVAFGDSPGVFSARGRKDFLILSVQNQNAVQAGAPMAVQGEDMLCFRGGETRARPPFLLRKILRGELAAGQEGPRPLLRGAAR